MASLAPAALGGTGGWMPLLAVSFLVGSWLLFPKLQEDNDVFDPGAEEMPRLNQSLRGVTLNTLFGTNRVSSNITWTANWNVERHETSSSGGDGKGGGSGGSKQPEQPGEVSYTYTWDIMCTLGMVPESYSLYGGWMNSQRLNDDTIAAIAQDLSVLNFKSFTSVPDEATLQFTDAFYHSGVASTDLTADNWDYWETQEGFTTRWPHVVWLGFETLNLGNQANLPQLEWEVGPGDAKITMLSGFIDDDDGGGGISSAEVNEFIIGDDGNKYVTSGFSVIKFDPDAGTYNVVQTITGTDIGDAITALGLDEDAQGQRTGMSMCAGQDKYFFTYSQGTRPSGSHSQAIICWKMNSGGTAEAVGAYNAVMAASFGYGFLGSEIGHCAVANAQEFSDPVLCFHDDSQTGTVRPAIRTFPSFEAMVIASEGGTGPYINLDEGVDEWFLYYQIHNVPATGAGASGTIGTNFGAHNTDRTSIRTQNFGFFLPTATVGALGLTWGTHFKWYISKADIKWHEDNPGAVSPDLPSQHIYDNQTAHPNGWVGTIDLGNVAHPAVTGIDIDDWFIDDANWIRQDTGASVMPYVNDDPASMKEGFDKDGTTADSRSGYTQPTVQKAHSGIAQGSYVLIHSKMFEPKAENSTTGEYVGARVYLWHPIAKTAYQIAEPIEGTTLDVVNDLGSPTPYAMNQWTAQFVWDQETNNVYKIQTQNGTSPIRDQHISLAASLEVGGVGDVLPPYIIYQILTNSAFGSGETADDIDQTSYEAALAYCRSEEIWVSVQYPRESSKLSVIEELLSLYGGYLTISGGKIKFGIQDASATSVRTLDNDRLVREGDKPPVTVTLSAKDDSFNRVLVNFFDRTLEYRQNQVEVNDEVDQDLTGIRKKEFPAKFVMSKQTATNLAERALWSNLYGKDTFNWAVGLKDSDLEAGDVITLVDSFHDQLQGGQDVRITRVSERRPGIIDMIGVTEIEYINTASIGAIDVTSATGRDPIYGPSRVPANQWAYELPREFHGSQPKVYVGYNALSTNRGAWLYASDDGVSYALVTAAEPFIISGILAAPLPVRPDGYLEQNIEVFLFPDTRSGFTASSPVYVNTFTLETTGAAGRQGGLNTVIINSEAMAYQDVTLLGQNHYRFDRLYRGWGGTHIQAHNSGAYWHRHGGGVFGIEYNEDKVGITTSYKVVPYNFAGQGVDVSSVTASSYTIQGAYFRPQIQGTIHTFPHSVDGGLSSVDMRGKERLDVNATGCQIDFLWSEAARLSGWGTQGYGAGGYGRFAIDDAASTQYRVEVLSNDLSTVVRCTTVSTGFYEYTVNANSEDFNGWNGDFLFKMTPFNDFGDAPRTATKRLRAF